MMRHLLPSAEYPERYENNSAERQWRSRVIIPISDYTIIVILERDLLVGILRREASAVESLLFPKESAPENGCREAKADLRY
jgi:hypothetical protein